MKVGRFIRTLTGRHGHRELEADMLMKQYVESATPQKREIATRGAAVERLVSQLERDASWYSRSDSSQR